MTDHFPDYYAILGVDTDAIVEEIKQAYRQKSRTSHPDILRREKEDYLNRMRELKVEPSVVAVHMFDEKITQAEETQKLLNEAYEVLSDQAKRAAYDKKRAVELGNQEAEFQTSTLLLDFQTLVQGQRATKDFVVTLIRGNTTDLALSIKADSWIECVVEEDPQNTFPITIEVTIDTGKLGPGRYETEVVFIANTVQYPVTVRVEVQEDIARYTAAPVPPPPFTPPPTVPMPPFATAAAPPPLVSPHARRNRLVTGCFLIIVLLLIIVPTLCRIMTTPPASVLISQGGGIIATSTPKIITPTPKFNSMSNAFEVPQGQPLNFNGLSDPQWSSYGLFISWQTPQGILMLSSDLKTFSEVITKLGKSTSAIKWSPIAQEIAYVYDDEQNGNSGIWLMTIDGKKRAIWHSKEIDLTEETLDFDWSPDGSQIVFTINGELYFTSRNGEHLTKVEIPVSARKPSWSPDGKFVSFESVINSNGTNKNIVVVVNADGTSPRTLPGASDTPRWIPNTNKISAHKDGGKNTIVFEDPFTTPTTDFMSRNVVFAPGGQTYLSYVDNVLKLNNGVVLSATVLNERSWSADWSPDGTRFALSVGQHAYVYTKDGVLVAELTQK